jgi:hypothetical protein
VDDFLSVIFVPLADGDLLQFIRLPSETSTFELSKNILDVSVAFMTSLKFCTCIIFSDLLLVKRVK